MHRFNVVEHMSIFLTRFYGYVLKHPKTKRGSWGHWYYRERYVKVLGEIMKYGGTLSHLLDVGCGGGLYAHYLHQGKPSCFYIGCDASKTEINNAYKDQNTNYILCDAHALPLRSGSLEIVLCSEVLEHLSSPYQALTSICNVSRRTIIVTFPDEPLRRIIGIKHTEHISTIDLNKVVTELKSNGYKVLKISVVRRFSVPCGILEFLRIPVNRATKLFVRLLDSAVDRFVPIIFIPYQVVLVVATRINIKRLYASLDKI